MFNLLEKREPYSLTKFFVPFFSFQIKPHAYFTLCSCASYQQVMVPAQVLRKDCKQSQRGKYGEDKGCCAGQIRETKQQNQKLLAYSIKYLVIILGV